MMEDIFEIAYKNQDKTIIKVKQPLTTFQLAMYPFLSGTMEYLTIQEKEDLFTVIHSSGNTITISSGTLITDDFKQLRKEAKKFARTHI